MPLSYPISQILGYMASLSLASLLLGTNQYLSSIDVQNGSQV
jgi:hypothetical protein